MTRLFAVPTLVYYVFTGVDEGEMAMAAPGMTGEPARLLVIDDDVPTASYLERGLREQGFEARALMDARAATETILRDRPDLVILDSMMPGKEGLTILAEVRQAGCQVPILMLTARDSIQDRVRGLEAGADDYLIKPFALSELLARIGSVLRRQRKVAAPATQVQINDLSIDLLTRRVRRGVREIELTGKEFEVLTLLATHPGLTFSKREIARRVWKVNFDTNTNIVEVQIRRLRMKLEDEAQDGLIQTIRGVGYAIRA
jgi:two-component system copper resistance phosphate regulon response regulator CusR